MRRVIGLVFVSMLASCVGEIGSVETDDPTIGPNACNGANVGKTPMRRLTRWEYNNVVLDLLGDTTSPASAFVPEAGQFGFDNNVDGAALNDLVIEQFETAATDVAERATLDLPKLLACDAAAEGEEACAVAFIDRFVTKAFRRKLEADEKSRFLALYQAHRATSDYKTAIGMIIRGTLQSPSFLYRLEFGMPDPVLGATRLLPHEVASRLSFLLWGSVPDDALLERAARGDLATPAAVREEAERMLEDERGARALKNFFSQWGQLRLLESIERPDTGYDDTIGQLMKTETETFVDEVIRHGDGQFETLLTAPFTYVNADLAAYYGFEGPAGDAFERVELDPHRYSGILSQGSLMAILAHPGQPSPVHRGVFIREKLFCSPLPPPPDDVDITLPEIDPTATARQQLEQKTNVSPCVDCHAIINPVGFAFESFDESGRFREDDHGLPIDASGVFEGADKSGPFEDHTDLARLIADSEDARACFVLNWFRYANGRERTEEDQCASSELEKAFESSGGNVREMLLTLASSKSFLYRDTITGGEK